MKPKKDGLITPIYLKTEKDMPAPEEKVAYILSRDGLFVYRNHQFFTSCVPARVWPPELDSLEPFIAPRYPRISGRLLEHAVGFFAAVAKLSGAESIVMIIWDMKAQKTRLMIPRQRCTVMDTPSGVILPIGVQYHQPAIPAHCILYGDIHSHVDATASASDIDRRDERFRPGLHIIVGRLNQHDPPDFCVETVVDGVRFTLDKTVVLDLDGYRRRIERVPKRWLDKVRVAKEPAYTYPGDLNTGDGAFCHDPNGRSGNCEKTV